MTAAPWRRSEPPAAQDFHQNATALFDTLAAAEAPEYPALGRFPTSGERATALIDAFWGSARVVSFDVFDTLIVRKVAAPRDVFLHLATPAPFVDWGLDAVKLAQLRQQAEHEARRRGAGARGSGEVTLHEIHAVLAELLARPATDVPAMVQAERLVERALCVAHPHLHTLFERAVAEGKIVWCVSDTYHEAAFLTELLAGCGFSLAGVQVTSSADVRMAKGEGRLLTTLASDAGVRPADVLHIGDHPQSDHAIPLGQGFMAVWHPWAASRHEDRPASTAGDALALGLAQIGSRTVEPAFPFWWRFGYAVAGPMLSGFAQWLHARFAVDGVQRAYFLLRDGEIMLDVYRAMVGDRGGPETALLESSRRAFMVPALEAGCPSVTAQLLACENPRPAREFLERIGLRSADFGAAFRAVGITSPDEMIARSDATAMGRVAALFGRTDVVTAMVSRSRSERTLLWKYLAQEGVLAPGRVALVDIGWNGTIQKALMATARVERTPLQVSGYYLGTQPAIAQDLGGSTASGFLFEAGAPAERARAVGQLQQLVEFICTTTRGSLRGFRAEGTRVVPVHSAVDHPDEQHEAIAQLRAGAVAYARGLSQELQVFGAQVITPEAALRHFARTVQQPTAEEAVCIGDIRHGEGLGADRVRAFAAFSAAPIAPDTLMRDHAQAYWPAGLLARREPAAMALRTLLWLRSA